MVATWYQPLSFDIAPCLIYNKTVKSIALINVVFDGDYQYDQEIPLGLASLGAYLRVHNYSVSYHQCFASKGDEQFDAAAAIRADVYGFQLNMVNYEATLDVIRRLKATCPARITVVGGPFLAGIYKEIMQTEPLIDFMALGEGELTMLELLRALDSTQPDFSLIDGLIWRTSERAATQNRVRQLIDDLDSLPPPSRDFLEDARRDPVDGGIVESIRMITSRGCIGRCKFCCVNMFSELQKGKRWRGRSPKNVADELQALSETYKARIFNFSDSSFEDPGEIGKARSKEICEQIIRRAIPVSIKIYMRCETMRKQEDIELLKLYKAAGIDVIIVGVESGSDYELQLYGKNASLEDNIRTISMLRELDLFYVLVGFIMFGPNSTLETLKNNIDFLHRFGLADNLMQTANILILVRGSKLYSMLKEEGRVIEGQRIWHTPKYLFYDKKAERLAKHYHNLFVRYPVTRQLNTLQINMSNVITRMYNRMNEKILDALGTQFANFKARHMDFSGALGQLQYDYFKETIDMVDGNCTDEALNEKAEQFFNKTYGHYVPLCQKDYDEFLTAVAERNFSLSGLVFKHFYSAIALDGTERVKIA
ncbi:MAG: B12-binding domain-containing radical SAM protein [Candidatus Magnetominusculus sp. LBB02]|nr:B12-binding domain-containing radical SAM protein [Candidatus Magnetominusculus sp. LBB02]